VIEGVPRELRFNQHNPCFSEFVELVTPMCLSPTLIGGKGVKRALLAPIVRRRPERKFGVLVEVCANRITHCVFYNVRTWTHKGSTKVQRGFQAESPSQEGSRSRFCSSSPTKKNRPLYTRRSCDCAAGKKDQNPKWEYVFSATLSLCSDALFS
jgi:hypothetical protein